MGADAPATAPEVTRSGPATAHVGRAPAAPLLPRARPLPLTYHASRITRYVQALLLALTLVGAFAFAIQVARWPDHPLADMSHVTRWARNIQREGIEVAYAGVYPESYLIYPPGMAYAYQAAVRLAEHVSPPAWVAAGDWLRICIKLIPIAGHIALALSLFGIVAATGSFWRGWIAATVYAWNPASLFDVAYWGQGDSLHSLLLVLALGAVCLFPSWWPVRVQGRSRLGAQAGALAGAATAGALLAAAGMTKPQAWVFLPLVLWVTLRRTGPLGLAAAFATAAASVWWIVQPWVRAGRVDEMLSVFVNITQVMPSVSANAHNLWWLKFPGTAIVVLDSQPVGGIGAWQAPPFVSHATVGRLGFGLFALLPLLRLTGPLSLRLVFAGAAYTAAGFFMTVTQVHENHMFAVLPFLAAAVALDGWFLLPFLTSTFCIFANMVLHDFLIGGWLAAGLAEWLPWQRPVDIQTANAALNVAGFAIFTGLLLRRPPGTAQARSALRLRAQLVLLTGITLAGSAVSALLAVLRSPALAQWVWERLAASAVSANPWEAKLGHKTPDELLLVRPAIEFANLLFTLAGVAAIVGAAAALAGAWWLVAARSAPHSEMVR